MRKLAQWISASNALVWVNNPAHPRVRMTQTRFSFAPPATGPRVSIRRDDAGAARLFHGSFATALGTVVALGSDDALWALGLTGTLDADEVLADLARRWPQAGLIAAPGRLAPAITALVEGRGAITLHLEGTPFQQQVWQALLEVPPGEVTTYAALAARIGRPRALRAVGTAVGQNPLSWIIPCHRVVRSDGSIGGYHWGVAVKHALLTREGASIAPRTISAL